MSQWQKGIKFRIYLNMKQQNLINQILGCYRLIYKKDLVMRSNPIRPVLKLATHKLLQF
ncbi:helix-turn-helix domain-containing protein [Thomasclavelia ramosa]|uniref:helix-turn-helix domain-containing protein n=1 Tax=Thomasclavelia ramosa TaxID=1547 RepID=UPI000E4A0F7E|nr:helix-turn-helix domain-containing protein [Thomasclavelia ramosa]MCB5487941.1 helix-turn-helix domain-containing protein [Thomasclavelia ramosa]MCB5508925.1 helix-turn-helix domain-containing protein [Thomasclavelia ramosa]MCB5512960.1 helix-turn-helix domain-containing protein [Thomasclavelia ramosa]MCB5598456.1 helix-turn-helix domain-containing protein [Thomasclavelia ramosa]